jgi:hypothetical protein
MNIQHEAAMSRVDTALETAAKALDAALRRIAAAKTTFRRAASETADRNLGAIWTQCICAEDDLHRAMSSMAAAGAEAEGARVAMYEAAR